jgi:nicotinate-nucleotide adenylyltransferase
VSLPAVRAAAGKAVTRASARSAPDPTGRRQPADGTARRVGVLGGTFDPPHIGHLWLATLAADQVGLDRVLLMPAARPPHKGTARVGNAADRVLMTRLAISGDPLLEVTLIEMERPGPSYTVDSIAELLAAYGPETQLVLLMASDQLAVIDTWRQPDRLLDLAEWAVAPRPGSPMLERAALVERFGPAASRIHLLHGPMLDVSSTEIRRRVAAGRSIRYLVPRAVEELIADRGLYRRPAGST